ncbi:MAG: TIM barrel protein [Ktedonobacteraceae bacterium]
MKFAFSTLACPRWSVEQIVGNAVDMGYDGIEWRLLDGTIIDPVRDYTKVVNAVATCRTSGLDVCAFDTSCSFNHVELEARTKQIADLLNWIQLAQEVHVPIVRVFGGPGQQNISPLPSQAEIDTWVADSLRQVVSEAERASVTVALETHDAFASAHRVAGILQLVNSSNVAALWDSHHPYRVGESVTDVIEALTGRIAHVHVKDARRNSADSTSWQLTLLGEGEVPIREQLQLLIQQGYSNYVSVEWEKHWHPELAEPEIALPQHISWLKQFSSL